jgi:hypothetical protein
MGKLSALGRAIGERARAAAAQAEADQAAKVTTKDSRAARASWGTALVQLGQLLGTIGAGLLTGAYEDAESTAGQAHDHGNEQRRADEAEAAAMRVQPGLVDEGQAPDVDEGQAAAADPSAPAWYPTIEGGAEPAAAADAGS